MIQWPTHKWKAKVRRRRRRLIARANTPEQVGGAL